METTKSQTEADMKIENPIQKQKKQRQRNSPNVYTSNEDRMKLIDLVLRTNSVRKAAKILGMNESTAKSIYYSYKKSGNFTRKNKIASLLKYQE